jgi:hypothetical protein
MVTAESRLVEHQHGWAVVLDGERIAELNFLRIDPPFYLFRARFLTTDAQKIDYGLRGTAKREPEERLEFHSLSSGAVVAPPVYSCVSDRAAQAQRSPNQ